MCTLGKADFRQQLFRQFFCCRFVGSAHAQWTEHHVFQRRQVREQIKLLEHHTRFLTNQTLVHFWVVHFQTIDKQIAAGDLFQLVDAAQQR
ncbi:hypothetical protein D3C78_571200 [compost metagenome]